MSEEQGWRKFFDTIDTNNSGSISCTELENLLTLIYEEVEEKKSKGAIKKEAQDLLKACDKDGSGEISWDEFRNAMKEAQKA